MTTKKPTVSERKYNETEAAARSIIAAENAAQTAKTSRLKKARMAQEVPLDESFPAGTRYADPAGSSMANRRKGGHRR